MAVSRSEALNALNLYLSGKVPDQKLYEWALSQVVAKDYEYTVGSDPLLSEALQAIIDMSNPGQGHVAEKDDIQYYADCLEGKVLFEPLQVRLEKAKAKEREAEQNRRRKMIRKMSGAYDMYLLWARIYVVLFASCSFLINAVSVFRPELFGTQGEPSLLSSFLEALPHLVYTGTLLLPYRITAKGWAFFIYFAIYVLGMLAYWVATVSIIIGMNLHLYFLLIFAPFGGIPPAIGVWLLWEKRKEILNKDAGVKLV